MASMFFKRPARPDSPLPDTSILEAGLIEDDEPVTQPAEVYDEVRHLLRNSVFGSVASSPESTRRGRKYDAPLTPPDSPIARRPSPFELPTPPLTPTRPAQAAAATANMGSTTLSSQQPSLGSAHAALQGELFPPLRPVPQSHQPQHRSEMFNTRALAALSHSDLTDPSMEFFSQQKLQSQQGQLPRTGTTKPKPVARRGRHHDSRSHARRAALRLQSWVVGVATLFLGALVATYIGIMMNTTAQSSVAFNVLFVLGIILAMILFAWSVIRLFMLAGRGRKSKLRPLWMNPNDRGENVHQRRHHRRAHHHRGHSQRHGPSRRPSEKASTVGTNSGEAFVPTEPIQVHIASDAKSLASTFGGAPTQEVGNEATPKPDTLPNAPPAYGRWRGSVLANPELLHWQPVKPLEDPSTPTCASPTYAEAMADVMASIMSQSSGGPPTYATRESPARDAIVHEARAEIFELQMAEAVRIELAGPEMVEIRADDVAARSK